MSLSTRYSLERVVGEDGLDGIAVDGAHIDFQRCLQELSSRGILLAIAGKNNFNDVAEVLEHKAEMLLKERIFLRQKYIGV